MNYIDTLLGTNTSHPKSLLKMIFPSQVGYVSSLEGKHILHVIMFFFGLSDFFEKCVGIFVQNMKRLETYNFPICVGDST